MEFDRTTTIGTCTGTDIHSINVDKDKRPNVPIELGPDETAHVILSAANAAVMCAMKGATIPPKWGQLRCDGGRSPFVVELSATTGIGFLGMFVQQHLEEYLLPGGQEEHPCDFWERWSLTICGVATIEIEVTSVKLERNRYGGISVCPMYSVRGPSIGCYRNQH